jgi:hypothetical protein
MNFEQLQAGYEKWLNFDDDPGLLRIVVSAIVANRLEGNPVWLMLIGSAGCGKSEMLMSIGDADNTYTISSLTPYALMSGYGNSEENSLINKLNGKLLIIKDLSATTEINSDDRGLLFSFLRDAYDGQVARATGRGEVRFEGKFGILAAGTLAIESGRKMEALLGERFLYVRPRFKGEKIMEMSIKHATRKEEMRKALKGYAKKFLDNFKPPPKRTLPQIVIDTCRESARILVQTRSVILRDWRSKDIEFPAEVQEIPSRVYEQFLLLALAMRSLGTDTDMIIKYIKRVLLDSIPYVRMRALEALSEGAKSNVDVAKKMRMSVTPTSRVIEDLSSLGVVGKNKSGELYVKNSILDGALKNGVRKP